MPASGALFRVHPLRSVLFCPGSSPERFPKAFASGADAVCLDLEDGVAPGRKDEAREAVARFLAERGDVSGASGRGTDPGSSGAAGGPEPIVRINGLRTEAGRRDLERLGVLAPGARPRTLMVPKVDSPEDLIELALLLSEGFDGGRIPSLLPLVETAAGLHRVAEVALAGLPLRGLAFGAMDLAAELGARVEWEGLLYARSRVVHAAALAGVGALDVPWADLTDEEGLREEAHRVSRLGFQGKLAIHPAQVETIHQAFRPEPEEIAMARRIVDAAERSAGGVAVVDGRMVDRPVVLAAWRVLARAGEGRES